MALALDNTETSRAHSSLVAAEAHCESCRFGPTQVFQFERRTGFILFRTVHATRPLRLCKDCARATGRSYQADTMALGWWGILSAVLNPLSIWRNWQGLRRAMHMDSPKPTPAATPVDLPLRVGRPVHLRARVWILPALAALIAGFAVYDGLQQGDAQPGPAASIVATDSEVPARAFSNGFFADFEVGNCVSGGVTATAVYCWEAHNGEIVERVTSAASCPSYAESYIQDGRWVYCIDDR